MRIREQIVLSCCKKRTYTRHITCAEVDDAEIAEARLREDNAGNYKHTARDKSSDSVGEDVLEHNTGVLSTERSRNQNIFLIFETVELHSRTACHSRPTGKEERDKQDQHVRCIEVILEKRD